MAEFALGLTKTAVEGTLSLVKSAIEEEKKLREKVENDLVFITGEFEVMQSFLQGASREHARNDKVALTLVRQLRTLAFDVEDCVEYVIHLDLDKSSIWGGGAAASVADGELPRATAAPGRRGGRYQAAQGQGRGCEPQKHALQPHPPRLRQ